jgi:voltage-gated potassium channel
LIGSLPTLGFLRYTALLRLARLSRLARITKLTRNKNKHEIVADVLQNRGSYALFITMILALTVLVVCGAAVLQAESRSSEANIVTGADALWWSIVTLTTVGYGDYYPVTGAGRIIGVVVMVSGVGIIASLASMLTSLLIPPAVAASPSSTRSQDAVPAGAEHAAELLDEAH